MKIAIVCLAVLICGFAALIWNRNRKERRRVVESQIQENARQACSQIPQRKYAALSRWEDVTSSMIGRPVVRTDDGFGFNIPFVMTSAKVTPMHTEGKGDRYYLYYTTTTGKHLNVELVEGLLSYYTASQAMLYEVNRPYNEFTSEVYRKRLKFLTGVKMVALDRFLEPFTYSVEAVGVNFIKLHYHDGALAGTTCLQPLTRKLPAVVEILVQ